MTCVPLSALRRHLPRKYLIADAIYFILNKCLDLVKPQALAAVGKIGIFGVFAFWERVDKIQLVIYTICISPPQAYLQCPNRGGTFFMNSLKPPLSFNGQLSKLESRGLIIDDKNEALNILHSVNYYRLHAYSPKALHLMKIQNYLAANLRDISVMMIISKIKFIISF